MNHALLYIFSIPELLLRPKTDVRGCDSKFGRNALTWSVCNGHIECAMLLLKYSSDINQSDNEGKTALMHVCKLFNPEMKTLFDAILIHKQLDILKVDVDGWTALHWSSVNGHEQLVKKIISKFSSNSSLINMCDTFGRNSLMLAANRGHLRVLRELISRGSDIDCVDTDGKSGLMLAARCGHAHCVLELHKNGAHIDRVDSDGQPALFLAASNYHKNCVKTLLGLGCVLQYSNNNNINVLSIISADKVLFDVLIAAGCVPHSDHCIHKETIHKYEALSLLEQCRSCIRGSLLSSFDGTRLVNLFTLVGRLPLPGQLKRYLVHNVIL